MPFKRLRWSNFWILQHKMRLSKIGPCLICYAESYHITQTFKVVGSSMLIFNNVLTPYRVKVFYRWLSLAAFAQAESGQEFGRNCSELRAKY